MQPPSSPPAPTAASNEVVPATSPRATEGAPGPARPVPSTVALLPSPSMPAALEQDGLLPITPRSSDKPPTTRATTPPPGRNLVIAGGVALGVGLALTGAAGYTGAQLAETYREARALRREVDGVATDDQLAMDHALTREYRELAPQTIGLAIAGGAAVVAAAVLLGVGGRRMRTASYAIVVPVPSGLAFHARF
jgi:hypothetical protein